MQIVHSQQNSHTYLWIYSKMEKVEKSNLIFILGDSAFYWFFSWFLHICHVSGIIKKTTVISSVVRLEACVKNVKQIIYNSVHCQKL